MTLDLERQLTGYGEQLETYVEPFMIDELVGETPSVFRPSGPRRRWVVVLAASLAVLLLVGGIAAAIRLLTQQPAVVDEPTTTSTVPGPSEEPSGGVSIVGSVGVPGEGPVAVLDTGGNPVLAYEVDGTIWLANCGDPTCSAGTETTEVASTTTLLYDLSLALLDDGSAAVSYVEQGLPQPADQPGITILKYAGPGGVTTIDEGNTTGVNGGRGLTVAGNGLPVLAYYTWTGERGEVVIFACGDLTCASGNTRTVIDIARGFSGLDLTVDADGNPAIAYSMFEGSSSLRLARCSDPACSAGATVTTLVEEQTFPPSLAFRSDGLPAVFVMGGHPNESSDDEVQPARLISCGDPNCEIRTETQIDQADPDIVRGRFTLTPDDLPVLTWVAENQLWVTRCQDPECATHTISATGIKAARDQYSSLMSADGVPTIAFSTGSELALVRCDESVCAAQPDQAPAGEALEVGGPFWSVTTVVPEGVGGLLNATLQPDGSPFLAYEADTGASGPEGEIDFEVGIVRCGDPACVRSENLVSSALDLGETSVAVPSDGLPIFAWDAFFTSESEGVAVGRCADPDCAQVDVSIVEPASIWFAPVLAIGGDGLPMLVYQDFREDPVPIELAICADPACQSSTIITLDQAEDAGPFSLVTDPQGLAAVAYGTFGGEFRLARCTDAACSEVTVEVFDDTGSNNEEPAQLAFGNDGLPIIAYDANNDFKVAACHDPACTEATVTVFSSHLSGFVRTVMIGPSGSPIVAFWADGTEWLAICESTTCEQFRVVELTGIPDRLDGVIAGSDGLPLLIYSTEVRELDPEEGPKAGNLVVAKCTDPACLGG